VQPFAITQQICQFFGTCHVQSNEYWDCNLSAAMKFVLGLLGLALRSDVHTPCIAAAAADDWITVFSSG